MHFSTLGSNLKRLSFSIYVRASQPKIRRYETSGLRPIASSHGVHRPGEAVTSWICTACAIASPQNWVVSSPDVASSDLAVLTMMSMYLSTGLKLGEYGAHGFC